MVFENCLRVQGRLIKTSIIFQYLKNLSTSNVAAKISKLLHSVWNVFVKRFSSLPSTTCSIYSFKISTVIRAPVIILFVLGNTLCWLQLCHNSICATSACLKYTHIKRINIALGIYMLAAGAINLRYYFRVVDSFCN